MKWHEWLGLATAILAGLSLPGFVLWIAWLTRLPQPNPWEVCGGTDEQ